MDGIDDSLEMLLHIDRTRLVDEFPAFDLRGFEELIQDRDGIADRRVHLIQQFHLRDLQFAEFLIEQEFGVPLDACQRRAQAMTQQCDHRVVFLTLIAKEPDFVSFAENKPCEEAETSNERERGEQNWHGCFSSV